MTTALTPLSSKGSSDNESSRTEKSHKEKSHKENTQSDNQYPTGKQSIDAQGTSALHIDTQTQSLIEAAKSAAMRAISQPEQAQAKNRPFIKRGAKVEAQSAAVQGAAAPTVASPFANVLDDPRHRAALEQMQKGNWDTVTVMLRKLVVDYPSDEGVNLLLNEAEFKRELDSEWGDTVKAKNSSFSPLRLLSSLAAIGLAMAIVFGGTYIYRSVILPNRAATASAGALQIRIDAAEYALQSGNYHKAAELYSALLTDDPTNSEFLTGLQKAERQIALEDEYAYAISILELGDLTQATALLEALEAKAPGYRDVAERLSEIQSVSEVAYLYTNASIAYDYEKWAQAAQMYEALRNLDGDFEAADVAKKLPEAYLNAGVALTQSTPESENHIGTAEEYFRKVLALRIGDPIAKGEVDLLITYSMGDRALTQQNLEQAIAILEPLYAERPAYLNYTVSQQLYDAYLVVGDELLADEKNFEAFELFGKAVKLEGIDTNGARERLGGVAILLTPTATPTSTPVPPTSVPPTAVPSATPIPSSTPIPPLEAFKGWIAFKSNRDGGSAVYVMPAGGGAAQPVGGDAWGKFDELYESQGWSTDRNTQVYTEKYEGDNSANLFLFRHDLPADWDRRTMITDFPGEEYDAAWSPTNQHIAFVSNTHDGDEIWTIRTDGTDIKRLTHNSWEWDKHPSWSPDGAQIIFWSNRTGMRQIWIMNADGSNQRALTTEYENWDPIWIR